MFIEVTKLDGNKIVLNTSNIEYFKEDAKISNSYIQMAGGRAFYVQDDYNTLKRRILFRKHKKTAN